MLGKVLDRLMSISAFQKAPNKGLLKIQDAQVDKVREMRGGMLSYLPTTRSRWLLGDIEDAQQACDIGNIEQAARLWQSAYKDGQFVGALTARSNGLLRLPKKFVGDQSLISELQFGQDSVRSVYEEMIPTSEAASMIESGLGLGVSVGELVPVKGRDYPVLTWLPPEYLSFRPNENRWYFRSVAGLLPVVPGDGRWVLHAPGGRIAPWNRGLWRPCGRAFITKEHAINHDANWQAKLAHPARVAVAPAGASDKLSQTWFQEVASWGINTVFGMYPGYDVKIVESNGRGHESFASTIERSNKEYVICLSGQEVTTTGGAGFQNSNIFQSIRRDFIQADALAWAYTVNTQILPYFTVQRRGPGAIESSPCVVYDTTPPADLMAMTNMMSQLPTALVGLKQILEADGRKLDMNEVIRLYNIPELKS